LGVTGNGVELCEYSGGCEGKVCGVEKIVGRKRKGFFFFNQVLKKVGI
jgi:hypothetical protein